MRLRGPHCRAAAFAQALAKPLSINISAQRPAPGLPPRKPRNSEAQRKQQAKEEFRARQRLYGDVPPPTQYSLPTLTTDTAPDRKYKHYTSPAHPQPIYLPSAHPPSTPQDVAAALNISLAAATQLLTAAPVLQEVTPKHLHESLVYLVLLLGAPTEAILKLAERHPDALTLPKTAMQADKLGFLCYLQQRSNLLEALTHPAFLRLCRPHCYLHQVCHISKCLDMPLEAVLDTLVACPTLVVLSYPPNRLRSLATRLAVELDLHEPGYLRSLLSQQPEVLLAAADSDGWDELQQRAGWLRQHGLLGRPLAAVPRLLEMSVAELAARVRALQAVLDLPLADAAQVAAKLPLLLLSGKSTLQARLTALATLLELPLPSARQLAISSPRLLTDRAGAAHSCILMLRQILAMEGERLQVLVTAAPQLLAHPSQLRGNCLVLVFAASLCSRWQSELAQMPISSLPWVLQQPELHTRRLLYLLRTHRSRTTSLVSALAMPDLEFRRAYPGYLRWRQGRLPPLKLTRQELVAFRRLAEAMPLHPELGRLPRGRRGRQSGASYDDEDGVDDGF